MDLKILNKGKIDTPAKLGDAGYDIYASDEPKVVGSIYQGLYYTAISHIEYDTHLNVEPEFDNYSGNFKFFLLLYPRSSIIKTNLVLANSVGVIDSGYRGNVKLCFKYITQPQDMKIVEGNTVAGKKASGIVSSIDPQRIYHKGDKIGQLVPCLHNYMNLELVDQLSSSNRGVGGFGSTDL